MIEKTVLWMAPMLGFTEQVFRNTYVKHFRGLDAAIAPFIGLTEGKKVKYSHFKDIYPEQNQAITTIPQVIGNKADQFVLMNRSLLDLGYTAVNWNLGCPAPRVAARRRGSGLLPYPEVIDEVLDTVFRNPHPEVSVKVRLGFRSPNEMDALLPIFNRYPLSMVVVHPRIGTQLYDGTVDLEQFERMATSLQHPVIYSGDIFTLTDVARFQQRFPMVQQLMLGRGIFRDPFLPEKLRGIAPTTVDEQRERFVVFVMDLFRNVVSNSTFEPNALNKIKEYWTQYSQLFEHPQRVFDRIKTMTSAVAMERALEEVLVGERFVGAAF